MPCRDCADHGPRPDRVRRGGGFKGSAPDETTSSRDSNPPDVAGDVGGARCARPL